MEHTEYLKGLLQEYTNLGTIGYNLLISQYTIFGGLLLLGGIIFTKDASRNKVLHVLFPFMIIMIYCIIFYNYCEIISLGGYRQAIGDILNKEYNSKIFNWENFTKKQFHQQNTLTSIQFLIAIAFLLLAIGNSVMKLSKIINEFEFNNLIRVC